MTNIAYFRVSSVDQNTERQLADLTFDKTFTDKCSGGDTKRPALNDLIDYMREGDTVHVHSIDRLARSLQDLLNLVASFNAKGVTLKFHKENMTFQAGGEKDPRQELMLSIMGSVAQFEKAMINERQREGIAKAKAQGVYSKERSKKVDREEVLALLESGLSHGQIAKKLGCSTKTVQRKKNS
ncbi:recombinase family protein [Pseudoalteromonas xiamenensis]|uniref:Recombinase family protein n=1 Tax=Pseudoalteromonas xiamenensis TaxID=882626 RepID=A0A975DHX2_9GAMM|nr:recombinase family protein [Pseudoalteromonas xiamenensis]QTH72032.1 recombinase family protein [Pseudoalteromonas xiamenensis]